MPGRASVFPLSIPPSSKSTWRVIYSSLGNLTFRLFFGSSVDLSLETDQRISLRIPDSCRESTLESHQLMILLEGTQYDLFKLIQPFESKAVLDFVRIFFPDTNPRQVAATLHQQPS